MTPINSSCRSNKSPHYMDHRQLEQEESHAIFEALIGQTENNALVVRFFTGIFNARIQVELNVIINDINTYYRFDAVTISVAVIKLLKEHGIELSQNGAGAIKMTRLVKTVHQSDRREAIETALCLNLPLELSDLVCSFDAQIKICRQSYGYIYEVMNSTDHPMKRLIIELAIAQNQVELLNTVFDEIKSRLGPLNLSSADLSGLNLSRFDFSNTDLSCANLSHTVLSKVDLCDSDLTNADLSFACLDCADLSHTNLTGAKLRHARLFLANLNYSNLTLADLAYADLNLANMHYSILYRCNLFHARMYKAALNSVSMEFAETDHAYYVHTLILDPNS